MKVLGISLITNTATGAESENINHEEVLMIANAARQRFVRLILGILRGL